MPLVCCNILQADITPLIKRRPGRPRKVPPTEPESNQMVRAVTAKSEAAEDLSPTPVSNRRRPGRPRKFMEVSLATS